ncbi:hypothetical protein Tco_0906038 [Tanacetum coccineum]
MESVGVQSASQGCSLSIHGAGLENSVGIKNSDGTLQGVEARSECQDTIGSRVQAPRADSASYDGMRGQHESYV